jgi:hypothetical protein
MGELKNKQHHNIPKLFSKDNMLMMTETLVTLPPKIKKY